MVHTRQFLFVRVEDVRFALDLNLVEQVCPAVELIPLTNVPDVILGLVNVHGSIIVVLSIRKRIGLANRDIELSDQLIIVNSEERQFALLVEDVESVHQILPDQIATENGVRVIKLDEEDIIIQEIKEFLTQDEEDKLTAALEMAYTKP